MYIHLTRTDLKTFKYSPSGSYLLLVGSKSIHLYSTLPSTQLLFSLPLANVLDYSFSPNENYLSIWTRYIKSTDNDTPTKNMNVYDIKTAQVVIGFTQKSSDGWDLQWTEDESYCAKQVSSEVHFYDPKKFEKGVQSRIKLEGIQSFSLSPGKRPVVAVFIAGKNGAPSSSRIYDIGNVSTPLSQKSFFRADRVTFHWNDIGTNVLVFTHTDVDKTGQSYYGETSLYYLSITGNHDCKVELGIYF